MASAAPDSAYPSQTGIMLYGQPVTAVPEDLFIPPDALAVFLESFEGPLDLLLYLIRKKNIDILDIPMAELTQQYLGYINGLGESRFELAAEYLLMAAMLIDIKTRLLLPKPPASEEEEADPRAELVKRLLEYERTQLQAKALDAHQLTGREFFPVYSLERGGDKEVLLPSVSYEDLAAAWQMIIKRATMNRRHVVTKEPLSVRAYMVEILKKLPEHRAMAFVELFEKMFTIAEIVIHFLAMLELIKEQMVDVIQAEPGSMIYLRRKQTDHGESTH